MFDPLNNAIAPRIWEVGALCRAVADALQARFNPVAVRGEITGFSRASSGHCYFSLKDAQGQIRCAMFRSAASRRSNACATGSAAVHQGIRAIAAGAAKIVLVVARGGCPARCGVCAASAGAPLACGAGASTGAR